MKKLSYLCLLLVFSWVTSYAQVIYSGPEVGNVASGVVKTTDEYFSTTSIVEPLDQKIRNKVKTPPEPFVFNSQSPAEDALLYVEDLSREMPARDAGQTVLLNDFAGNPMGNSIPPDPHMAVGPNHIITTVNTSFRIYDKEGNLLKDITADSWNSAALPAVDSFDPQVLYDHYEGRWIMLWDHYSEATSTAHFVVSVSDNEDPLGTWYVWALPAHTNGNQNAGNWGDYPGIGFDSQAIYILSRQFNFPGTARYYDKLRIISKAEIYASQGGALSWKDIWNISYANGAGRPDGIRPCVTYGPTTDAYFVHTERNGGGAINFYKLSNPLTNPVLTGTTITVPYYYAPPNANQLGGGNPPISSNGANLMMAPRVFNGNIYFAHAVRSSQHAGYSVVKYVKLDPSVPSVVEEFSYGSVGFFYLFPALDIDKDGNVAVNFSRSGDTEYAGAFYATRLATDPPGFNPSILLQPGLANYVVTYGGDRNRWGDYHGMYRDPVDQNNFWMLTEYVPSTNKWGTWVGNIRLVPFPGAHVFTRTEKYNFGNVEINNSSETVSITVKNYGENNLVITDIPQSSGPFHLVNNITFPVTLVPYVDSLVVEFQFSPVDTGHIEQVYSVNSNDAGFPGFEFKGKGYKIVPAVRNMLYAGSGVNNDGYILRIHPITGQGTLIGPSLYPDLRSLAVHPVTNVIYGLNTSATGTELVRVNAEKGDAYRLHIVTEGGAALPEMFSIIFDNSATLYGVIKSGKIYEIDITTGNATLKSSTGIQLSSVTVNPVTQEVWASLYAPTGSAKDKIFKINIETGQTTLIGQTGLTVMTNSLIFDGAGELYGTTGNSSQVSNFIQIDTLTAAGTIVGPIGYQQITSLAYYGDKFTSVNDNEPVVVTEYSLEQNYPNPFNPNTVINYSLPFASEVKLVVYNILGEMVKTLTNSEMTAGRHTINWNGDDELGSKVSSGVYFYELRAASVTGEKFSEMKKMIMMK